MNELAKQHADFLIHLAELERTIASDPAWPVSIYLPACDCWWSHFILADETIPHMRIFHAHDDEEVRFLTIMPVEVSGQ